MNAEPVPYARTELGFALAFPAASTILEDVEGAAVLALEPAAPGAFRANVNVVVEALDPPLGFDDYVARSLALERDVLRSYQLLDRSVATLGGAPALRTLVHHDVAGQAVALEQWRALVGSTAFVVSASCGALDYDAVAAAFADCAESFRLLPEHGSP